MLFKVDFQNDNLIWVQNTTEEACYFSIEHYFSISYIMIPMELRCCCKLIKHCDTLEPDALVVCSVEPSLSSCTIEEF